MIWQCGAGARPPEDLELVSPPWHAEVVDLDGGLGPSQNLVIEGRHEGAQLACALLGQGVQNGFEVIAEAAHVATAGDTASLGRHRVRDQSERAVGKGLPMPERFCRFLGPEAGAFEPAEIGRAGSGKAVDGRVPSPPRGADRELAPQG